MSQKLWKLIAMNESLTVRSQIVKLLSNPDDFRDWLFSIPSHTVVGISVSPCNCPVANYLKAKGGLDKVGVSSTSIEDLNGDDILAFSEILKLHWVEHFVNELDFSCEAEKRQVTASMALRVMECKSL